MKSSKTKVPFCADGEEEVAFERIITLHDYGKLTRLLRITALVIRFVENLKKKLKNDNCELKRNELSSDETENAERLWIRSIQKNNYDDNRFKQWEKDFGLFQDEKKILRCKGRISQASLDYESRFPAL